MDILTHTKRKNFKNCRRYYFNSHVRHLKHRASKPGRRRGDIFGGCLQSVRDWTSSPEEYAAVDECDNIEEVVRGCVGRYYSEVYPDSSREALKDEAEAVKIEVMAIAYIERYGVDQRREIEYLRPLVHPDTGDTHSRFILGGKIDGLIVTRPKHAVIIEDKFVSQFQKIMVDRLPLDEQTKEYIDALIWKGWTGEVEYRHTKYPTINTKKPKTFKTKEDYPGETLDEFAERLRDDIASRPSFYFDKQNLFFPLDDMEEYRRERWQTAEDIIETEKNGHWYRNPSRCYEFGGCEFIPLCAHQPDAESLYIVVPDNPELSEAPYAEESDA